VRQARSARLFGYLTKFISMQLKGCSGFFVGMQLFFWLAWCQEYMSLDALLSASYSVSFWSAAGCR
jgi:hypothetical protein